MINSLLDFLHSDPEFKKLDEACRTHHEAACKAQVSQDKHMREYLKWNCCKGALEWFNMDLNDSGDMAFTTLNHETCGEWIAEGAETFENRMAAALVKAGHAAERWIVNREEYESHAIDRENRREVLKKAWDEHQAEQQQEEE